MAVTRREQQMLDLADRGMSKAAIAAQLGLKESSVKRTLGMLSGSVSEDRRREQAIARGSARLLQAVLQAGGHH